MPSRGSRLVAVLVALLAATAAPAGAKTLVGSANVAAAPEAIANCDTTMGDICPAAFVQDTIKGTDVSTPAGVVVGFRFKGAGSVSLVVYRPTERSAGTLKAARVGASAGVTGAGADTVVEAMTRIPVRVGDMIGMLVPDQQEMGSLAVDQTGSRLWYALATGSGSIDTNTSFVAELQLQADVEADADGDGYGDETQDQCPTNAATQGPCPAPAPTPTPAPTPVPSPTPAPAPAPTAPPALRSAALATTAIGVSRSGAVAIGLVNPNPYEVKGKLALKYGERKAGSGSFKLINGATGLFSAKLPAAVKKALKRKRRLKLTLTITTTGPAGTSTTTQRRTITGRAGKTKLPSSPGGSTPGGGTTPGATPGGGTPTPAGPSLDGDYARPAGAAGPDMTFKVTGGGRKIVDFRGIIGGSCYSPGGFSFTSISAYIAAIEVAADGSFSASQDVEGTTTEVTGTLARSGIVTGTVKAKFASCSTTADFTSAHP